MSAGPQVTILLVDDDPLLRGLARELLEHLGYQVEVAGGGAEAMELLRRLPQVGLVVLDYWLAGEDGSEVLAALKAQDPGVRVLVASGFFDPQEVERLKEAGALGIIHKPFRLAALEARIKQALAGQPGF
jgi:CheY-like chemotaxis protein